MIMKLLSIICTVCIMAQASCVNASNSSSTTWVDPVSGIAFVWVQGGCYDMGMTDQEEAALRAAVPEWFFNKHYADEPRRQACPEGFWIAAQETTQAQWEAVTGYPHQACPGGDEATRPVVWITWSEADDFARTLTRLHNGTETFMLPQEVHWEAACRQQETAGSNRPVLLGMLDTPDEWVDTYYTKDGQPPVVEDPAAMRVLKGERCSNRRGAVPGYVNCGVGFRLVRLAPGPQ